jgi:peptidoglycan/xylan/chitin deacetylase (PgdA/CDA1 family)
VHSPSYPPVYLTFDDGPDPRWTPQILSVLAAAQVRATFFAIGACARRWPELLRRVSADGHEIANHTFEHRHPWMMSAAAARQQVIDGANAIADVLGRAPRFYRPPHGRNRRCMTEAARECGETSVHWDISAVDWGWLGTAERIAQRLERVCAGNIVLMHDGANRHNHPEELLRVLPRFLQELHGRNLRAVALGDVRA